MFVLPAIVEYLRRYPAMEVSALFVDRVVNLLEDRLDLGIHIGEVPDSSMKALRVRIGARGALRVAALSQAARHADRPSGAGKAHDHRRQRREPLKRVEISPRHEVDHGVSATETHGQQQ